MEVGGWWGGYADGGGGSGWVEVCVCACVEGGWGWGGAAAPALLEQPRPGAARAPCLAEVGRPGAVELDEGLVEVDPGCVACGGSGVCLGGGRAAGHPAWLRPGRAVPSAPHPSYQVNSWPSMKATKFLRRRGCVGVCVCGGGCCSKLIGGPAGCI